MKTISPENKADITRIMKTFICPKETVEGTAMVFNVKRNLMGELFIAMLRKALNTSTYKMRVRGSQSDRASLRKKGISVSDQSVQLEHSDRYRVYIDGVSYYDYHSVTQERNNLRDELRKARQEIKDLNKSHKAHSYSHTEEMEMDNRSLNITVQTFMELQSKSAY